MKQTAYILILISLVVNACQKAAPDAPGASEIWLSATVAPSVETRAPYTVAEPSTSSPLNVAVWASTTQYQYASRNLNGSFVAPENPDNYIVAKHTAARFQSGNTPQLLTDAVYPNPSGGGGSKPPVYFVGFYPDDGGWSTTDSEIGTDAIHPFDGKTDILFSPEISGYYGIPLAESPIFHFYHMLTWLRIEMTTDGATVLEREEVRDAWGKITSLKLTDQAGSLPNNTITIDLSTTPDMSSANFATRMANVAAKSSFSGSTAAMNLYVTDTDTVFPEVPGYSLPISASMQEAAYVICAPVVATPDDADPVDPQLTAEYTLTVVTEHRSALDIPIDLKTAADGWFTGSTVGKQFTISLTFKLGNTIAVAAAVTDWGIGGSGDASVTE